MPHRSTPTPSKTRRPRWQLLLLSAIAGTLLTGVLLCAGYIVLALWLFSGWGADTLTYRGKPLYFDLGEMTTHSLNLGERVVDLRVYAVDDGDDGAAAIEVLVNGQTQGKLMSRFNYDLYMNEHPGSYEVMDIDEDGQPEVVIHLPNWLGESYALNSQDDGLSPYQSRYHYPRPW
ncbi:MAG: hypothetical protein F6K00_20480 [Leptolyngbya sp. SIOISBB]|nr:hypothetical protein [Leptolyngbya sp. SIOISBB]